MNEIRMDAGTPDSVPFSYRITLHELWERLEQQFADEPAEAAIPIAPVIPEAEGS